MPQDRTEKLVSLTYALVGTRVGYTRSQLRSIVEDYSGLSDDAFLRKFERDKETLRRMGVPLEEYGRPEEVEGIGEPRYRIDPARFSLPELRLNPLQSAVLGTAALLVRGGALQRQAASAAGRLGVDAVRADGGVFTTIATSVPQLDALIRHTALGHPIRFSYRRPGQEASVEREVMPWGLGHRHGHWYLAAGDLARDAERLFRVDRIEGAVVQLIRPKEHYVAEAYGRPERWRMADALSRLERRSSRLQGIVDVPAGGGGRLAARASARRQLSGGGHRLEVATFDERDLAREALSEGGIVRAPAGAVREQRLLLEAAVAAQERETPTVKLGAIRAGKTSADLTVLRALDIVSYVVSQGSVTQAELRERFGLSKTGLATELTRLRMCGIPNGQHDELLDVEFDEDSVSISNAGPLSRPVNLSLAEAAAILIGLESLAAAPEEAMEAGTREAVHEVAALVRGLRPELDDFDEIVAVRPALAENAELAQRLGTAAREHRLVELDYAAGHGGVRLVEPLRLLDADGQSYLQAWCRRAEAPRTFRLDRVVDARVLAETFDSRAAHLADLAPAAFSSGPEDAEAVLAFDADVADAAAAYRPEAQARLSDDTLVVRVRSTRPEWIASLVASYGGRVRAVQPEALRASVSAELRSRLDAVNAAVDVDESGE